MKKQPQHGKKPVPPKDAQAKKPAAPAKGSEEALPKQAFLKRLIFGEEKPDLSEVEAGSTTILDILSPTAVDTKSRDYIVVDGIFHAYLYITGYGYSTTVRSGWLSRWWRPARASASTSSSSASPRTGPSARSPRPP